MSSHREHHLATCSHGHIHGPDEQILRFDNVTVCYGSIPALHHLDASVNCNSLTALIGPNGAGKSTLFKAILGWLPLTSGSIKIGDQHTHHILPRLAYLPQRTTVDWDFPATVRMVVEQGRFPTLGLWKRFGADDHRRVDEALAEMDLTSLADRQINALSGGQQQRVFLARALAQGADIFLLDEPFTGLDTRSRHDLIERLQTWQTQGRTVLCAVHDLDLAREVFSHALVINTHLISCGPVNESLSPDIIREVRGLNPSPKKGAA